MASPDSSWKEVLFEAARVSPEARSQLPAVVRLLEESAAGRPSVQAMSAVFAAPFPTPAPFVSELDRGVRARWAKMPPAMLSAARATLAVVPRLLGQLQLLGPQDELPKTGPGSVAAVLGQLAEEASAMSDKEQTAPHGALRCPRCGSPQVEERHTDAFEERMVEVRCAACRNYDSWSEGDARASQWRA